MMDLESELTVSQLARQVDAMDHASFRDSCVRHSSGVHVLPAPQHYHEWLATNPDHVEKLVNFAASFFDYVILDTPGTFNDVIEAGINCASKVIAVTSPELASLKNTCMLLEHLAFAKMASEDILVVLNHTTPVVTASADEITLALGREISWEVPHDRSIRMANQAGQQVVQAYPASMAAQSIRSLATVLAGSEAALARQTLTAVPARLHASRSRRHVSRLASVLPSLFSRL
jgi:pilus assembly protein CpaE